MDAAGEQVRGLHVRTKETVNLGMLRHDRVIYLEVLECVLPLRRIATRTSDPFHTTALGRAIAAHLPREKRQRLLAKARMERRTPATIVDRRKLLEMLDRVVEQGHAIEIDETDVGVMCVAAPIFAGAEVAGAISVSIPTARVTTASRASLVKLVRRAAAAASSRLAKAVRTPV
jgi:DNA-binding IclR family transcriptional regulator